jgi:hypothetical protein
MSSSAANYLLNEFEIQNNQSFPEQQRCEIFVETNLKYKTINHFLSSSAAKYL